VAVPQRHWGRLWHAQPPSATSEERDAISSPPRCNASCFLAILLAGPLLQVGIYCTKRATSRLFTVLLLVRMMKQEGKYHQPWWHEIPSKGLTHHLAAHQSLPRLSTATEVAHGSACQCFQQMLVAWRVRLGSAEQGDAIWLRSEGAN